MRKLMHGLIGSLALLLTLGLGSAAHADDWTDLDTDNSGDLTMDEWDAGFDDEGLYDEWDTDNDGVLSDDEYSAGLFDEYDQNDDGIWDEEEYGTWYDDAGDEGFWDV